ncbi:DUF4168 domain-containing protein [Aetokthonos hydrillicola Thurmond2011]|uniref:DUF4168 domain-containing protein n=2 Tax=Aetokthonos TaxID=1550243 RepID=A0AAP5I780_9CYAN|nr:DUF4168 domain-containing protein [Aetokthonos hydrillicola]MBO3462493.1 DUF4168 domain-containing protein [Aetokthonos hydrillicola CCALA 1050]MBW4588673.1 DUF4168 domain-containing protein [Aetokthonos hydrillicola CCALA 1050]MDR9895994.1 DUF4168 domain-containing protein [Aetokthonos hydrillicola Thurmond2011]
MLKQLLTGSYVLGLLLVGGLSAQAQVNQSSPSQAPGVTQPSSLPSPSQAPGATQSQISPDDLQKFARSIKQLRVIQQGEKQQIVQLITKSGLTGERFIEIYQAQKTPTQQPKKAITQTEQQQFNTAYSKIREIQQQTQPKKEQAVQKEGLQPSRFNQILEAVRQDTTLQQKVQQMIQQ